MTDGTWIERRALLNTNGAPVIAGARTPGAGPRWISTNPATGEAVAEIQAVSADQIDGACTAARQAGAAWAHSPRPERAEALMRWAAAIEAHAHELALLDSLEMGMPIAQAMDDIALITGHVGFCARALAEENHVVADSAGVAFNVREPHGVVAAITPWNFPLYTAVLKVAPALAMGNAVLLKPSEIASLSALRLGDLAREAGLPDGLFSVLPGAGAVGAALAAHGDVDHVAFTGSTATGRRIMQAAGTSNLKSLALECGGKGAQIVAPDVTDVAAWASTWAASAFWNAGQVCVAGARLIAPRARLAAIADALAAELPAWTPGDPLDPATRLGPLSSADHRDRVRSALARAAADGARVCASLETPPPAHGAYLNPVALRDVDPGAWIAQEEVFGPVLTLIGYDRVEEAIAIANGVAYGLSASVSCHDPALGAHFAAQLRAGLVSVMLAPGAAVPDGEGLAVEPRGLSGFGAEGGRAGLDGYGRLKLVTVSAAS